MSDNLTDNLAKLQQQAEAAKDGLTAASDLAAKARERLNDYYTASDVSER